MHLRRVLILTNCTSRKRHPAPLKLRARSLPRATYKTVSREWVRRVRNAPSEYVAGDLYCGRAVAETIRAASAVSGSVAFISAGVGVVSQCDLIPTYSLTVSSALPDSIEARLVERFDAREWWKALTDAMGVSGRLRQFILEHEAALILVALPKGYLEMIQEELIGLPASVQRTLRILGPRRAQDVPTALRSQWLPYDSRLDDPKTGSNGTTADFPSRALRHFTTEILIGCPHGSVKTHQSRVETALAAFRPYVRPRGATAADGQLLSAIRRLWRRHKGHRSRMLRDLRTSFGLACEQSRFRRLVDQVEARVS